RQHHHGAAHAGCNVPGNHRANSSWDTVIDEHARARRLPAENNLLSRIDECQVAAPRRAGGAVKINVMRHRVRLRIDKRNLDVVTLMNTHHRSGNGPVESHGLKLRPLPVDDNLLLLRYELKFNDLRAILGRLLVWMNKWWGNQFDLLTRQFEVLGC